MAKEISTGMGDIVQFLNEKQEEQSQMQWRSLRNKIDSLLLSTNVFKSDDARKKCLELDNLSPDDREEFITKYWGYNYLERVRPLLHQLKILESNLQKGFEAEGRPVED